MKKRLWAATLAVWIIGVAVAMQITLIQIDNKERVGAFYSGYTTEDSVYAVDIRKSGSYAYRIDKSGHLKKMSAADSFDFERFDAIVQADEGSGVLMSRVNKYLGYDGRSFKLSVFSDGLIPLKSSKVFTLPAGEQFSGLSQEAGTWYIATVSDDGTVANVYSIAGTELAEGSGVSEDTGNNTPGVSDTAAEDRGAGLLPKVYSKIATENAAYVDAVFRGGVLYIRTEAEAPNEFTAADKEARAVYDTTDLGTKNRLRIHTEYVWGFVVIMVLGMIFFLSLIIFEDKHPQIMWSVCVISVTAITFLVIGGLFKNNYDKVAQRQALDSLVKLTDKVSQGVFNSGIAGEDPDDLYISASYTNLKTLFNGPSTDMLLVDADDKIVMSGSNMNLTSPGELYGNEVEKAYQTAMMGNFVQEICNIHGYRYAVTANYLRKDYGLSYVVVGLDRLEYVSNSSVSTIWILLIAAFVIIVAIVIIKSAIESFELKRFLNAMVAVSSGKNAEVRIPEKRRSFLTKHWDALKEVIAELRRMDYATYQIYEAYFRFAPKKIETILDKSSIAEVSCGDVASFNGSEAILSLSDKFVGSGAGIFRMNELLELMEKHQDEKGGVLVSSDMSVGLVKLLFRNNAQPLSFGLNFLHEADTMWPGESINAAVILHHGDFRYGVVGTSRQSMAFLDSKESRVLEKYATWLYEQGMRLIITESMKEHVKITEGIRYIGYIDEEGVHLELYEVLDANTADMRAKKLDNLSRYNEALGHFKQSNFYFARNAFSEILRDAPGDALVKWYLFESERYLNQAPDDDLLRLHVD